ncbi:MAG: phage holin family protein [Methylotenera sp.]|uniref:phage holin family protein n=1 Tax=Methylotenera sp. TaxID=2051956 RepID=UPI0024872935|nr:phage holin family protein [Methylotenera sp.]MDI1308900.1 phage holin family protein [Methylotenera sp.]
MTEETKTDDEGLIASVKNIATTLLALIRTRLELLSTDLEEGWIRLTSLLVTAFVALFCLCFGMVLLSIFIIVLLWDTHRLLILGSLTGIFITAGVVLCVIAMRALKAMPHLFETSIIELAKDQKRLEDADKPV